MRMLCLVLALLFLGTSPALFGMQEPVAACGGHSNRHGGPASVTGSSTSSQAVADQAAHDSFTAKCKELVDTFGLSCDTPSCGIPGACQGYCESSEGSGSTTFRWETSNPHTYHTEITTPNRQWRLVCSTCD
jgi:hypothetical protein